MLKRKPSSFNLLQTGQNVYGKQHLDVDLNWFPHKYIFNLVVADVFTEISSVNFLSYFQLVVNASQPSLCDWVQHMAISATGTHALISHVSWLVSNRPENYQKMLAESSKLTSFGKSLEKLQSTVSHITLCTVSVFFFIITTLIIICVNVIV